MRQALLPAVMLALVLDSPAQAARWSPLEHAPAAVAETWVQQRTMETVEAAWPHGPCSGHVTVQRATLRQLQAVAAPGDVPHGAGLLGYSQVESCTALVREGLLPVEFCTIAVHEAGHLAGADHTDDPDDVMNPAPAPYGPCERALTRTGWQRIYDDLRGLLGPSWWLGRPVYSQRLGVYWVHAVNMRTGRRARPYCVSWTGESVRILGRGWNEIVWATRGHDESTVGEDCYSGTTRPRGV